MIKLFCGDYFACALGKLSGAHIVGAIRTANYRDAVLQAGAEDVVTGEELEGAERLGPFDRGLGWPIQWNAQSEISAVSLVMEVMSLPFFTNPNRKRRRQPS